MIDEDWSTLLTYQQLLDEGKGSSDAPTENPLIQQARLYGTG